MMHIGQNKKRDRWIGDICFCIYLFLLAYCLFLADIFGRTIDHQYAYNLIPFREIKRFLMYSQIIGMKSVLINLVGNVLCFSPLGFYLPFRNWRFRRSWIVFLTGFFVSLFIEVVQLLSRSGSFDVDDMILNTLGCMIGYVLYLCTCKKKEMTSDEAEY